MKKVFFILPLLLAHISNAQTTQQLENITAFNRLYGYVKYFHPSDEAAAIDWDKFAIYGTTRPNLQSSFNNSLAFIISNAMPS